jgi:hypothetical protein
LFLQLAGKTEANFYVGFLGQFPEETYLQASEQNPAGQILVSSDVVHPG